MKGFKVFLLIISIYLVSGCASKFQGTWCKFAMVPTSLVILDYDISDDDLNNIIDYVSTIENLKSYDVIEKIEEASKMVTVYYKNEDNIYSSMDEDRLTLKCYKYRRLKYCQQFPINLLLSEFEVGATYYSQIRSP